MIYDPGYNSGKHHAPQTCERTSYPMTPVDCLLSELRECFDLSADGLISRRQFENRVAEFKNAIEEIE